MTLFRNLLAVVAATAIAIPAFAADDATTSTTTTTDSSMTQSTEQATKVDLNTATAKELTSVKGISASKARAIISYRKKHGEFKTTDDLVQVKGFKKLKPEQLKDIQDQLSVQ